MRFNIVSLREPLTARPTSEQLSDRHTWRRLLMATAVVALLIAGSYVYRAVSTPPPAVDNAMQAALYGDAPAGTAFTDQLIASLQDRLRQYPEDERGYATLGAAYLQKARESGDPAYYSKTEAVLKKALALQAGDFEALASMGVLALARHQFREGLDYGSRARALNVYNARALGVIVDAQVELGDYAAAVQSLQSMVDLRPDMGSYARVSYLRELNGDPGGALSMMRRAVEAGSGVPEQLAWTRTHVGLLLFNNGDLDGAQREYEDSLQASPAYVPARAGLARVLAARGDFEGAIAIYEDVTRIMPLPEYVIALGDCYTRAGRTAYAARAYELVRAIAQLQRANGVDIDLEMALFEADHLGQAGTVAAVSSAPAGDIVAQARQAYANRPTIYGADALAWALYQSGQAADARQWTEVALKLNTQDALLWFHAGMIDARLGNRAAAREKLAHAVELNPYFSLLWSDSARETLARLQD
jgi:tetratricopeptide (TPR) repeat protein